MNNSSSELNFRTASGSNNNNNNNNNQKKLEKHSVSMYQIQQLVELHSDQQLYDSSTDILKKDSISSTSSKRTFVRNTAGSFDLNVNNLNLNESQSNLKIIIEAQQNDCNYSVQNSNLPIDSALTTSATALAASAFSNSIIRPTYSRPVSPHIRANSALCSYSLPISKSSIENEPNDKSRLFTSSTFEFASKYEEKKTNYNENKTQLCVDDDDVLLSNEQNGMNSIDLSNNETNDDLNLLSNNNISALPFHNEILLNNCKNFDTIDSIDLNDETYENLNKESTTSHESNKNTKNKKQKKTSAFAWVGRTVGKRINKHQFAYNNHHHHTRRNPSPNTNLNNTYSILTTSPVSPDSFTVAASANRPIISKKAIRIDWTENAKQGIHMWSDVNNTQSVDSCYLNEPDALEFHKLKSSVKCLSSSKGEMKKKCLICKLVVHETCIEKLQHNVKCRSTFREAVTRKKSFRDKDHSITNPANLNSSVSNLHHWICRKYDENNFENKCKACFKSYTNRFGLQTNRTIISCSWCKISYHLKCFPNNLLKTECSFGDLSPLIVPPNWIVKSANKNSLRTNHLLKPYHRTSKRAHQQIIENSPNRVKINENANSTNDNSNLLSVTNHNQISIRATNKPFIIRPPSSNLSPNLALAKPLLVLINPKSGGKLGPKLLKKFGWYLNARQVFDLTQPGCPKFPLHLFRNVPNLRLLVGGGDGTVGWVLSIIDQINFLITPPAIAVLPLGTGNDLARVLNWGSVYTDEPLSKILTKVLESRIVKLDRWKITTELNPDVDLNSLIENSENAIDKLKNDVMNNYFSLGADAHICLDFHERREANPQKFSNRWFNLLHYVESGSKDLIKKTWKDLKDYIKLECDNKSFTEVIRARGYHFIIFLNISKYSGGTNPWGSSSNDPIFQSQSMNDGYIEVIGCYSSTLAKLQLGGAGERICQAKYIKLTTSTYIPIQIDGEPAKLSPSIIEIKHKNQAFMLEHVKYNTDSPVFDYNSSIHKNFQVKCILESDYDKLCKLKDPEHLKNKAIHIGTIYTSKLDECLSQVRNTINMLINDSSNGFTTSKWSFLNGEEFYRITDEQDEVLLDIVSGKETLFILDEDPCAKNKSDFVFAKTHKIQESFDSTKSEVKINQAPKDDYEDYDLEDYNESDNDSIEVNKIETSNQHLNFVSHVEKIRSSQSSPKIFDNQGLVHIHTISSSKSTQFISIASSKSNTDQF